jgi:catalase
MTEKFTTTDAGNPAPSDDQSLTVGPDGPILLQDHYLIEQMANFNRERIPERHTPRAAVLRPIRGHSGRQPYTKAACSGPTPRPGMVIFTVADGQPRHLAGRVALR